MKLIAIFAAAFLAALLAPLAAPAADDALVPLSPEVLEWCRANPLGDAYRVSERKVAIAENEYSVESANARKSGTADLPKTQAILAELQRKRRDARALHKALRDHISASYIKRTAEPLPLELADWCGKPDGATPEERYQSEISRFDDELNALELSARDTALSLAALEEVHLSIIAGRTRAKQLESQLEIAKSLSGLARRELLDAQCQTVHGVVADYDALNASVSGRIRAIRDEASVAQFELSCADYVGIVTNLSAWTSARNGKEVGLAAIAAGLKKRGRRNAGAGESEDSLEAAREALADFDNNWTPWLSGMRKVAAMFNQKTYENTVGDAAVKNLSKTISGTSLTPRISASRERVRMAVRSAEPKARDEKTAVTKIQGRIEILADSGKMRDYARIIRERINAK